MPYINYNGIEVKCPSCGTTQNSDWYKKTGLFDLSMHILYSNQHGCSIRLFCGNCTDVHEFTITYSEPENVKIEKCSWQCEKTPTTQELTAKYGKYVALRENVASVSASRFDDYNQVCMSTWRLMKKLGCYVDYEGSELKPEYREIYHENFDKHYRKRS